MGEVSMQKWAEQVLERRKASKNSVVEVELDGCETARDYNHDKQDFSDLEMGLKALEEFKLITFSGYDGMISVWTDDKDHYRGEFVSYGEVLSRTSTTMLPELTAWLKEWLKKINK